MLKVQLETLAIQLSDHKAPTLQDVVTYLRTFSPSQLAFYSELVIIVKLILVNPSTNAVSER